MKDASRRIWRDQRGFTLIEIVVTIIISAILAVILAQVMSEQSWRSYWPLQAYDDSLVLKQAMENITSDYTQLVRVDPSPLITLQDRVNQASPLYWDPATVIQVTQNYCLTLGEEGSANPGESSPVADCGADDTLLKLTLSFGNQSLTALFSR